MAGVKRKLQFPPQNPKFEQQWVVIQGPKFSCVRHPQGWSELSPKLQINFEEADTAMGFLAAHYAQHKIDVVVESVDGDCLWSLIDGTHERVEKSNNSIESVEFCNRVTFVQSRWSRNRTKVFDVNMMWQAIQTTFNGIASRGFEIANPPGTYLALSFLTQNDYVRNFPGIGAKTHYRKFFRYVDEIFSTGPLVGNHWAEPGRFSVNWHTFKRLVVAFYCKSEADFDNVDFFLQSLNRKDFSLTRVRVTYANLVWCLRYFNATLYQLPTPDPFAVNQNGTSLYGYVYRDDEQNDRGGVNVDFADEVDVWELHADFC
jgi:hypothetical protein